MRTSKEELEFQQSELVEVNKLLKGKLDKKEREELQLYKTAVSEVIESLENTKARDYSAFLWLTNNNGQKDRATEDN